MFENRRVVFAFLGVLACAGPGLLPRLALAARPLSCDNPRGRVAYSCLGAKRAKSVILQDLREGRHVGDASALAARLDIREAVPLLRAMLDDPHPRDVWRQGDVARALAAFGDRRSAGRIAKLARRAEGRYSSLWEAAVLSLGDLEAPEAATYAQSVLSRTSSLESVEARALARGVLPIVVRGRVTEAQSVLDQWAEQTRASGSSLHASINGARMRLGDAKLLRRMRKGLGTANAVVPAWPEHYVAALGDHPDDVPALLRFAGATSPEARRAYDAIDRLTGHLDNAGSPSGRRARAQLVSGLQELTSYRENRSHVQFEARQLARHHVSLARLGHQPSRDRLLELAQESPHTIIPWIAARHALDLGLPGARDRAAALMLAGTRSRHQFRDARIALVDQAALSFGASDARWTVMLADANVFARERALHHFSRIRPTGACQVVIAAAAEANRDGSDDGLLALTVLGDGCRAELEQILPRRDVHPAFWGTALEVLAMMGSQSAMEWAQRVRFRRHLRPFAERAMAIRRANR